MEVVLIASGLISLSLYQSLLAGEPVTDDRIAAIDTANVILGVGSLVVTVGTGVAFIRWLLQARRNAVALGAGELVHSRHTAVWSWFIPIIDLFLPYQVVKEIWQASAPAPEPEGGVPGVLRAWWGFWVAATVLAQLGFRMNWGLGENSDWADYSDVERVMLAAAVPSIVAAVLAMRVVRGLDDRQRARALRLADETVHPARAALA
ncbi:MAG TPA: DUF4328 domain-containing protein [Longimicrobium sp.]|nr:DUF4328 domain-containing protein [Longimicrobium sp.]